MGEDVQLPQLRSCDFTSDGCTDNDCDYCYGPTALRGVDPLHAAKDAIIAQLRQRDVELCQRVERLTAMLRDAVLDQLTITAQRDHLMVALAEACDMLTMQPEVRTELQRNGWSELARIHHLRSLLAQKETT